VRDRSGMFGKEFIRFQRLTHRACWHTTTFPPKPEEPWCILVMQSNTQASRARKWKTFATAAEGMTSADSSPSPPWESCSIALPVQVDEKATGLDFGFGRHGGVGDGLRMCHGWKRWLNADGKERQRYCGNEECTVRQRQSPEP
jgi:hypothetical protein